MKSDFFKPLLSRLNSLLVCMSLLVFIGFQSCQMQDEFDEPNSNNLKNATIQEGNSITYWGHETFTRNTGKPEVVKKKIGSADLIHFEPGLVLHLKNGDGTNNLVSSAIVKLDGKQIFGPSDFSQNVPELSKEITGLTETSELEVEVRGAPNSFFDIWIEGKILPGKIWVTPSGGMFQFSFENYKLELEILPNTFADNQIITIKEEVPEEYNGLFQLFNFIPIGNILNIECSQKTFNYPIKLKAELLNGSSLQNGILFQIQEETNSLVFYENTIIDEELDFIQIEVDHFSRWVLGLYDFKWDLDNIYYYIGDDTSGDLWGDSTDPRKRVKLVSDAVKTWQNYQCRFKLVEVNNEQDANIIYKVVSEGNYAGKTTGINGLFHTISDSKQKIIIEINSNADNFYYQPDRLPLTIIPTHEMGHALGLRHYINKSQCNLYNSTELAYPMMSAWILPSFENTEKEMQRKITVCDIEQLQHRYGKECLNQMLYVAYQDPNVLITPGVPGSHYKEIKEWENAGFKIDFLSTVPPSNPEITKEKLSKYKVLRLTNYYPHNYTIEEGQAIFDWVNAGGKLLADICYNADVNAVKLFGVERIDGEQGGRYGLSWAFHGAPLVISPVSGPFAAVSSIGIEAMDRPVIQTNKFKIDAYAPNTTIPAVVHQEYANGGKVVITFNTGAYSLDVVHPYNAYRASITMRDNLQFVKNVIQYLK